MAFAGHHHSKETQVLQSVHFFGSILVKNQAIKISNLFVHDDSPFRAPINADTTFKASLGNFVSHVQLLL
jgi:hypothetical protein